MVNRSVQLTLCTFIRVLDAESFTLLILHTCPTATTVTAARQDSRVTTVRRTFLNVPLTPVSMVVGVWSR